MVQVRHCRVERPQRADRGPVIAPERVLDRRGRRVTWHGDGLCSIRRGGPGSGARVRLVERLPQSLDRHVGVELRGRERRVAEDLLDGPQVRPALDQVGCSAVPQPVRSEVRRPGHIGQPAVDHGPAG